MSKYQVTDSRNGLNKDAFTDIAVSPYLKGVGNQYRTVFIVGERRTGKSTLLNHLFGTSFRVEASSSKGGMWIEGAGGRIPHVVFDYEHAEGMETYGGTTLLEQAMLLALTVTDILIINTSEDEIERRSISALPLLIATLKTTLKLKRLVRGKLHLMFVVRDYTGNAEKERLRAILAKEVIKAWSNAPETNGRLPRFSDSFELDFKAIASYVSCYGEFMQDVKEIRDCVFASEGYIKREKPPIHVFGNQMAEIVNEMTSKDDRKQATRSPSESDDGWPADDVSSMETFKTHHVPAKLHRSSQSMPPLNNPMSQPVPCEPIDSSFYESPQAGVCGLIKIGTNTDKTGRETVGRYLGHHAVKYDPRSCDSYWAIWHERFKKANYWEFIPAEHDTYYLRVADRDNPALEGDGYYLTVNWDNYDQRDHCTSYTSVSKTRRTQWRIIKQHKERFQLQVASNDGIRKSAFLASHVSEDADKRDTECNYATVTLDAAKTVILEFVRLPSRV